jgi:hypothetical protein
MTEQITGKKNKGAEGTAALANYDAKSGAEVALVAGVFLLLFVVVPPVLQTKGFEIPDKPTFDFLSCPQVVSHASPGSGSALCQSIPVTGVMRCILYADMRRSR